ncbi:hypothetical protein PI125_g5006 [Phytophthora idaei]|nr:hypothetical protein PI125_g5006 [Phytophthora idaei]
MTMAGPRANIVHSPDFESGCVRVLRGKGARLTRAEKAALEPFALSAIPAAHDAEEDENESFAERFRKKRRLMQQEQQYELLRSIPPTSNII